MNQNDTEDPEALKSYNLTKTEQFYSFVDRVVIFLETKEMIRIISLIDNKKVYFQT